MDLNYFTGVLTDEERDVLEEALNTFLDHLGHTGRHGQRVLNWREERRGAIAAELIKRCQP